MVSISHYYWSNLVKLDIYLNKKFLPLMNKEGRVINLSLAAGYL